MAIYYDQIISGKGNSLTIMDGDSAYNTIVRNSAVLYAKSGGYVESTTVYNSASLSNTGYALSTFLSGGTMTLSEGGSAQTVSALRGAKLTVSLGAVATDVFIAASAAVNATVRGGDGVTRLEGVNESGDSFSLSNGVASNFLLDSAGQLTVLSGGSAKDVVIRAAAQLTVSAGAIASGVTQFHGGKLNTTIRGGDGQTYVAGSNVSGTFLLSDGVASGFILYENAAQHVSNGGVALRTRVSSGWAHQFVYAGGTALETTVCNKGSMTVHAGSVVRDTLIYSGGSMILTGGDARGTTVYGVLLVSSAPVGPDEPVASSVLRDLEIMPGGMLNLNVNSVIFSGTVTIRGEVTTAAGITMNVSPGAEVCNLSVGAGAKINASSGTTLTDLAAASGAQVRISSGAVLAGANLDLAKNTIYYSGTALGMTAAYGRVSELGADGKAYDLAFGAGVTVAGARIVSGGRLNALSGAVLDDTVIVSGGQLVLSSGADTGRRLFFDFSNAPSGGSITGMVNDLSLVSSETAICLTGIADGGVYTVNSAADIHIYRDPSETADITLAAGESGTDVFGGMTYTFDGTTLTAEALAESPVVLSSYASLNDSATEIGDDLAAVWANFTATGNLAAVDWDFGGNAWLELEGTDLSGARLYGVADGEYMNGVVNLMLTSGTVVGNLAAGAGALGAVGGVNLTIDAATLEGASYAGGFGNVAYFDDEHGGDWTFGDVTAHIKSGTFKKDFYAGALANYKKTGEGSETDVGNVTLTVDGGTFDGNLYGASAVKVNSPGAGNIHSVNDVFITLNGGVTTSGKMFCLFSGGYATGTGNQVYSVNNIDLAVNGGQWGVCQGGRGIFGGIMASGVAATAGDVNIVVTGGELGNLYGGGWAQKNGLSSVHDVNILITGGKLSHILGGGSHSTSGGTTTVHDVNIVVSGGDIEGDIYARGHFAGDNVTGAANVTFTGATDFACDVWGYSYVDSTDESNVTLNFTDYTGCFSGDIGGFGEGIRFTSSTAMTLTAAADGVFNELWRFDVTGRDAALAGTSMLNWNVADLDFTGDTISLNLNPGDTTEWSLLRAATGTVYGEFDVLSDMVSILTDTIGLDEAIADTGTGWDGWGFTVEDNVLKFKNLA